MDDVLEVETVERWWNGNWGKMGRRDIWLERVEVWRARGRLRGEGGDEVTYWWSGPKAEAQARQMVEALKRGSPDVVWRDLSGSIKRPGRQGVQSD